MSVTLSAAAGASAFGLMVVGAFDEGFRHQVTGVRLVSYALVSVIVTWLATRFLEPMRDLIRGESRQLAAQHLANEEESEKRFKDPATYNKIKVSVLVFAGLVLLRIGENLLEHGLRAEGAFAVITLVQSSLVAGVVTYYWASAVALHAPSVAGRAAFSTVIIGAVLTSPVALLIAFLTMGAMTPVRPTSQDAQAMLLVGVLVFVGFAIYGGILLFGLYAYAGGQALDRLRISPVAWRVAIGLIPAAILFTLLAALAIHYRGIEGLELSWPIDYLTQVAIVAGWALGLRVDRSAETALAMGRR